MTETDSNFCDEFFSNPAISYTTQSDLELLFETLADTKSRFTVVVGAGVSLDAGLPLWHRLIDNIIEQISDIKWRREAQLDQNDLTRKAEYVIRLAGESTASPPRVVILNALYRKSSGNTNVIRHPQPGRLADATARLCASLGDRVDIVTTNFDVLLESALQKYKGTEQIRSVPFQENLDDTGWAQGKGVLHLHGILKPGEDPIGDIVLTESDFLQHGPRIRSFLLDRIKTTHLLFIGVSMTDSNLIGPLWEFSNPQPDAHSGSEHETGSEPASLPSLCFMLSVAAPNPRSSEGVATTDEARKHELESRRFAIKRTNYLRNTLGVKTIFFKSFGQQIQAVCEASLALRDYEKYKLHDKATSSRYGFRFMRTLNDSYRNIGCPDDAEMPTGDHADALSDRLHKYLDDQDGLFSTIVKNARSRTAGTALRDEFEIYQSQFARERFGLFLWLRSRDSERNDSYELRLVGSSAYRHRDAWSLDRKADISPTSRFPAGRAIFRGQADISDFPINSIWQLWGAAWAVPFSHYLEASERTGTDAGARDSVEVGVICLQSTHFWSETAWKAGRPRSILSALTEQQENRLIDVLAGIGREIVTRPIGDPT